VRVHVELELNFVGETFEFGVDAPDDFRAELEVWLDRMISEQRCPLGPFEVLSVDAEVQP